MNENKALIRDYLRALSGRSKTPDLVAGFTGDATLAKHIAEAESAFPEYELVAQEMIGEGDLVVVRGEMRGVHRGVFAGIEATGKSVSAGVIIIYRIAGSKIVEHWMQFDTLGLLQQLQKPQAVSA